GQVLGQGAPLTARAPDVEHRVEPLAPINPARPRPALRDINEGAGQRPFSIGHISWVTQTLAVIRATGLSFPHQRASSTAAPAKITSASPNSPFPRTGSEAFGARPTCVTV